MIRERISVNASKKYEVLIGNDMTGDFGAELNRVFNGEKILMLRDLNAPDKFVENIVGSAKKSGYKVIVYDFTATENFKSFESYLQIIEFMSENGFTRYDGIVALGGGITGDLAGFVAATYMRGITLVQIPTTLLACVDSAIGGKTALNTHFSKNIVGAFYQPSLVFFDRETLNTLSQNDLKSGCGECVKYAILMGGEIVDHLKKCGADELFIKKCIEYKGGIVELDEKDKGERALLNLGHTFGHAIEKLSGFTVSHGMAVAKGIDIIKNISIKKGYLSADESDRITELFNILGLDVSYQYNAEELINAAATDKKKTADGELTLVLIHGFGDCRLEKFTTSELKKLL